MGWGSILGGAAGTFLGGPVGGAIGSGLGGFLEQGMANDFNSAQASANRDFQASMSGTAYQRAMADMRAAGLNPMLAYSQGGASVPTGATASYAAVPDASSSVAALSSQVSSAASAKQADVAETQVKSNVALQKEQARKTAAEAGMTENALRQADAFIDAVAQKFGVQVVSMSEKDEALQKYFSQTKVVSELAAAGASVAANVNNEQLQKWLNMPAANALMQAAQVVLRAILVMKH